MRKRSALMLAGAVGLGVMVGCRKQTAQRPAPPPPPVAVTPTPPPLTPAVEEKLPPAPKLASLATLKASVKEYRVSPSLREVTNLKPFAQKVPLTPQQRTMLAKNLFVCGPTAQEQLFFIYENNDYLDIPSFVTTDTVLHLYHVFYDYSLRTVESDRLWPALNDLTTGMLAESAKQWRAAKDPKVKAAALRNVAFFGVAAKVLGRNPVLPTEVQSMVKRELALIDKHVGFDQGAIFPYKIDYSQFVPRGHYTKTPLLKRYFRAMMWFGLTPFTRPRDVLDKQLANQPLRQGLLITQALYSKKLDAKWETIYEPTAFYVGTADDQTPAEWKKATEDVYGKSPTLDAFGDDATLDRFATAASAIRPPRIAAREVLRKEMPEQEFQFRLMGQRYIPDSEILQRLSVPVKRVFPSGLDVMAVLGSDQAVEILDKNAPIYNAGNWEQYPSEREKLRSEFGALKPSVWTSNLYYNWLFTLQPLLEPAPAGFPSFMRTEAWQDKSLNTALASWTELRHDTILYGKQSAVECGDGREIVPVKGYVEPNPVLYDRLMQLNRQMKDGLVRRKIMPEGLDGKFQQFDDMLKFLKTVSLKELRGEKLTAQEYEEIRFFGAKLEYLTLAVMEGTPSYWELVSQSDRDMALVADVHTGDNKALTEAVGHPYEILVIAPVEGKPTLTRGACFSYFEFKQPISNRLTDEAWQKMLKAGKAPAPPTWTKSFVNPGKPKKLKPGQVEVYSSGC